MIATMAHPMVLIVRILPPELGEDGVESVRSDRGGSFDCDASDMWPSMGGVLGPQGVLNCGTLPVPV